MTDRQRENPKFMILHPNSWYWLFMMQEKIRALRKWLKLNSKEEMISTGDDTILIKHDIIAELSFFSKLNVNFYLPLILVLMNSLSILYEIFPFILEHVPEQQ